MAQEGHDEFISNARSACSPMASLDFEHDETDLQPLTSIVGDRKVVGLGENWHSAKQLLQAKYRIARFLIERLNFSTLIFEGSLPGAYTANRFVTESVGTAVEALRALGQAMWLNSESVTFLNWLHGYNKTAQRKVVVYGMDSMPATSALFSVPKFLEQIDPSFDIPYRESIRHVAELFCNVPLDSASRAAIWGAGDVYDGLTQSQRDEVRSSFQSIVSNLVQHQAIYTKQSSVGDYQRTLRGAVVILQAWDILGARKRSLRNATEARAFAFAENVSWINGQTDPSDRAVIFAHNIHVAKQPFVSFDSDVPVRSMGQYLSDLIPGEYLAIGASVGSGQLSGGNPGLVQSYLDRENIRQNGDMSVDAVLAQLGKKAFIIKTPDVQWARRSHAMRSHLNPSTDYAPAEAFDAWLYVDQILPATAL